MNSVLNLLRLGTVRIALALGCSLLTSCTSLDAPLEFAGPIARLQDTGFFKDHQLAVHFAGTEIDGRQMWNMTDETRRRVSGLGNSVGILTVVRDIPARQVRMKLGEPTLLARP
jgi:hypothetical protein